MAETYTAAGRKLTESTGDVGTYDPETGIITWRKPDSLEVPMLPWTKAGVPPQRLGQVWQGEHVYRQDTARPHPTSDPRKHPTTSPLDPAVPWDSEQPFVQPAGCPGEYPQAERLRPEPLPRAHLGDEGLNPHSPKWRSHLCFLHWAAQRVCCEKSVTLSSHRTRLKRFLWVL